MKKKILLNGIIVGEYEATGDVEKDLLGVREFLKNKGLDKNVSTNDAMFTQANSFAETANHIYSRNLRKSPYRGPAVAPFIVNACFSIEIYIKTMLDACGKSSKEHDLTRLFQSLDNEIKQVVFAAAADVRSRYKLPDSSTFDSCLTDLSRAFVDWRYLYEHHRLSAELQSIRYTMHTAFEATCRVREQCA